MGSNLGMKLAGTIMPTYRRRVTGVPQMPFEVHQMIRFP